MIKSSSHKQKYIIVACVIMVLLCPCDSVKAHDISKYNLGTRITLVLSENRIEFIFLVEIKNFPAVNERSRADKNKDMSVSNEEVEQYRKERVAELLENIMIKVNDRDVKVDLSNVEVIKMDGAVDRSWFAIQISGEIPRKAAEYFTKLEYYNSNFMSIDADGLQKNPIINDIVISVSTKLENFRTYPIGLMYEFEDPERPGHIWKNMELNRHFFVEYGVKSSSLEIEPMTDNEILLKKDAASSKKTQPIQNAGSWTRQLQIKLRNFLNNSVNKTLSSNTASAWLWLFLVSLFVGVLHALGPGHGKSVVFSYLVGSKGTAGDAVLLAIIVTVAHTLVIIAISLVMMLIQTFTPDKYYNQMLIYGGFVSGIAIVIIGTYLLFSRIETWSQEEKEEEEQAKNILKEGRGKNKAHKLKQIFILGFSSGLIPCLPSLAALILCWRYHHYIKGFIVILIMSLGTALTVLAFGLMAVMGNLGVKKISEMKTGFIGRSAVWIYPKLQRPMALLVVVFGILIAWGAYGFLKKSRTAPVLISIQEQKKLLEKELAVNPEDVESLKKLSVIYASEGDLDNAGMLLEKITGIKPSDYEANLFLGHMAQKNNDYRKSHDYYSSLAATYPNDARVLFNLGYTADKIGNDSLSAFSYAKAVTLKPDYLKAHFNLGLSYLKSSRLDDAYNEFQSCRKINDNDISVLAALALTSIRKKDYITALDYYSRILEFDPNNFSARRLAANICYLRLNQPGQAKEYLKKYSNKELDETVAPLVIKLLKETVKITDTNKWEVPVEADRFSGWAPISTPALLSTLQNARLEAKKVVVGALGSSMDPAATPALLDEFFRREIWNENSMQTFDKETGVVPYVVIIKWALTKCYKDDYLNDLALHFIRVADGETSREYNITSFLRELAREKEKELIGEIVGFLEVDEHVEKALRAIGYFGISAEVSTERLIELTTHKDKKFRLGAYKALSQVGFDKPEIIKIFTEGLKNGDRETRIAASNALARLSTKSEIAIEVIVASADAREPEIRKNAAFLFGVFEAGRMDILEKLMDDPDENVQTAAITAIGNREDEAKHLIPKLEKIVKTTRNTYVRMAAEDALEDIKFYHDEE
jgi:ABC-type nickel/cobalt efflux system permease component RcnA/Tfp pilus assembly protein PilF